MYTPHDVHVTIKGIEIYRAGDEGYWVRIDEVDNPDEAYEDLQLFFKNHKSFVAVLNLIYIKERLDVAERAMRSGRWFDTDAQEAIRRFGRYGNDFLKGLIKLAKEQSIVNTDEFDDLPAFAESLYDEMQEDDRLSRRRRMQYKYTECKPGYVYVFQISTGHYKIGYSNDPDRRMREIIGTLPITIDEVHRIPTNQMACAEEELHRRFKHARTQNGEWFELCEKDVIELRCIEELNYDWLATPATA